MVSGGTQDDIDPCRFAGGTKFAVGLEAVYSEWSGDFEEEATRAIDSDLALRPGDNVGTEA